MAIPCVDNTSLTVMQLLVTALVLWAIYVYVWDVDVTTGPSLIKLGGGAVPEAAGAEGLRGTGQAASGGGAY